MTEPPLGTFTIWFNDNREQGLTFNGIASEPATEYAALLRRNKPFTIIEADGTRTDTIGMTGISHTTWKPDADPT